jgi:hypothetical protein
MNDPVWGDKLIALRQSQLRQLQVFRNQAIERRLDLVWQHRKERLSCINLLDRAKLMCHQTQQLIELQQQKQHDYEVLRNQHATAVYKLLQVKIRHS